MKWVSSSIILLSLGVTDQLETHIVFDHWRDQAYTRQMALSDFGDIVSTDNFLIEHGENLSIDNSTLTFQMLKDKVWIEGSGAQIVMPIVPQSTMTLEYSVYFDGGGRQAPRRGWRSWLHRR